MADELSGRLAALFAEYRQAFPDFEPSPNFMPGVWARIEARQRDAWSFRRFAQAIITAAAAVSLLMGAYLVFPQRQSPFYTNSYVELLAAGESHDTLDDAEIVQQHDRR